jgi:hypothetical protein
MNVDHQEYLVFLNLPIKSSSFVPAGSLVKWITQLSNPFFIGIVFSYSFYNI